MKKTKTIVQNKDKLVVIEEFLVKVSEMYQYNLSNYPEENPTMVGAWQEILDEYKELPDES
jgi:F0F1-type ATP synthase beta subunit